MVVCFLSSVRRRPMGVLVPKPERVGSGSFRVDRARALATLSSRRFPDAAVFLDCWIRCAEASGATAVELSQDRGVWHPDHFVLSFDAAVPGIGGDPWEPLFSPSPRTAAAEELAKGMLACLGSRPSKLRVEAGALRLAARDLESAHWEPSRGRVGTVIRADWPGAAPDWPGRLKRSRFWLSRAGFGSETAETYPGGVFADVRRGRCRIRLHPRAIGGARSIVHLYRLGVRVESVEVDWPACVCVHANDDAAELSVDLQRVAAGARRDRLLALTRVHIDDLLRVAIARHRAHFPEVARRLEEPAKLSFWKSRHGRSATWDDIGDSSRPTAGRPLPLVFAGWLADWLHGANSPLLEDVPLFFAGRGKTLTLADLRAELDREGVVAWSGSPGAAPVWCPSPGELPWLTRHFGAALRQV